MSAPRHPLGSPRLDRITQRTRIGSVPYRVADRAQRTLARRQLPDALDDRVMVRLDRQLLLVRTIPGITAEDTTRMSLDAAVEAASSLGLPHFLVSPPRHERTTIGVIAVDLAPLVERLAELAPDGYVDFSDARGTRRDLLCRLDPTDLDGVQQVTLFMLVRPNPAVRPFGTRHGCTITLWTRDGDDLVTRVPNPVSTRVEPSRATPVRVTVTDREVETLEAFDTRRVEEVDFPIDAVYLWVDGADPDWRERRDRALAESTGQHELSTAASRFREYGELRYSLRSVEKFAPWIRHVYLVTDQQRPEWLVDAHPNLTVIDHREIFTDPSVLPTFNSHAISTQIHHIDGLADQYLVFNDDVLLGRPVQPELFFDANGVAKFFLSKATVPAGDITDRDLPHEAARKRSRDLVEDRYGHTPTRAFKHTPIAQVRTLQELLERRYRDEYQRTAGNRFRSVDDLEPVSWLHHYAGYFERWTRPGAITYDYFNIADRAALDRMDSRLTGHSLDCMCVNDADEGNAGVAERAERLRAFFETLLPERSSFESGDP